MNRLELQKGHPLIILFTLFFIGFASVFIFLENYLFLIFPIILVIVYLAIFYKTNLFLLLIFCTPLSINLESFTDGKIGLFLPTEPLLFGLMILTIMHQIKHKIISNHFWTNGIVLSLLFYMYWILITAVSSTHIDVSFKYFLMKLWYLIPIFGLGHIVFQEKKNITKFFWLFTISMTIVISFTLIRHWGYNFGEKEGHWVMSPIFKDHTIYGAIVAINLCFLLGLFFSKKHIPLIQVILILMLIITITGLYFSYTRGAWLSVLAAFIVYLFIRFKVKFKYLLTTTIIATFLIWISWDQIQIYLEKNRAEHTTEEFNERIQSAANITSDASNLERLNRWSAAWKMFKEKPIFGFGPATYAFEYAPYQDPENLTIISTNFGNKGNAHSEFLGPLAEMGLLGLISICIFIGILFYKSIRLFISYPQLNQEDNEIRIYMLFMILALVTYFTHGVLNNYLDTDKASVPIYCISAIVVSLELKLRKRKLNKS